jgi:hypothetical protein
MAEHCPHASVFADFFVSLCHSPTPFISLSHQSTSHPAF